MRMMYAPRPEWPRIFYAIYLKWRFLMEGITRVIEFKPCVGLRCKYRDKYYWLTHTSDCGLTWSLDVAPPGPALYTNVPISELSPSWSISSILYLIKTHYLFKMYSRYDAHMERHRKMRATYLRPKAVFWTYEGRSLRSVGYNPYQGTVTLKSTDGYVQTVPAHTAAPESFFQMLGLDHERFH